MSPRASAPKRSRSRAGKQVDAGDEVQIYSRIPRDTREKLKQLADADDRKLAVYIRRLLISHAEEKGK